MATTNEFRSLVFALYPVGGKYNKKEAYQTYIATFPNLPKIEQNTYTRWLKLYAESKGYGFHESHSGDDNFFEFVSDE